MTSAGINVIEPDACIRLDGPARQLTAAPKCDGPLRSRENPKERTLEADDSAWSSLVLYQSFFSAGYQIDRVGGCAL
jgi:hypothetical protein